ncbi:MAG: serine protease [Candidatus Gracilibacteria bacterium]
MKKLLFLIGILYIIASIFFIKIFLLDKNITKISNKIENSIVIIVPEQKLVQYKTNPKGIFENNKNSGIGAGFIISTDGEIQTVNHIVENENINYKVILNNTEYNAKVLSRDKERDLAILKINTPLLLTPLIFEESNLNESIISYGVDIQTLTITSNTGTIINKKSKLDSMSNLLEISNTLKPGFSGGPIINLNGKVIGINYAISEGKNYGIISPSIFLQ